MSKRKRFLPLFMFFLMPISSCASGNDWNQIGTSRIINYCLLIGQVDHNDSAARTAGIRDVLGTRDIKHKRSNPNTENPVRNDDFYTDSKGRKYSVVEMEHAEQKSISGATWDQQTANESATLWINKHYSNRWKDLNDKERYGQSISLFISNNDGMAMGALGSVRWMKGMPIFGYDANADALEAMHDGRLFGTVDSAGTGQAAAIYMAARNFIENPLFSNEQAVTSGFGQENENIFGYVGSKFAAYDPVNHTKLCDSVAVTSSNLGKYYGKTIEQRLETEEHILSPRGKTKYPIYHSYYSNTDNFLNSTMKPLFNALADKMSFEVTVTSGNGNDESLSLDNLDGALGKGKDAYKAFILNMVKTTSTKSYLDKIYSVYADDKGKVHVPVIFWNRQPTTETGTVDTAIMNDSRFEHILYIGFDANQGGKIQGEMIKSYIMDIIAKN